MYDQQKIQDIEERLSTLSSKIDDVSGALQHLAKNSNQEVVGKMIGEARAEFESLLRDYSYQARMDASDEKKAILFNDIVSDLHENADVLTGVTDAMLGAFLELPDHIKKEISEMVKTSMGLPLSVDAITAIITSFVTANKNVNNEKTNKLIISILAKVIKSKLG